MDELTYLLITLVCKAFTVKYRGFGAMILTLITGMSEPGGPAEMAPNVWDKQTDVNLRSVYLCCHFVLPIMEKQGSGVVINIASIAVSSQSKLKFPISHEVGYAVYWEASSSLLSNKGCCNSIH